MTSTGSARPASPSSQSARTYRLAWNVQLGLYAYAAFCLTAGVALLIGCAQASTLTGAILGAVLAPVCLLGGAYVALDAALARVVLTADEVVLHGLRRLRRIPRADSEHYRVLRTRGGSVLIDARKSLREAISLPELAAADQFFAARFGDLKDLELRGSTSAHTFLELAFPGEAAEQLARFERASKLQQRMAVTGAAAGLWAMFVPRPFALAAAALVVLPLPVLFLVARSRGNLGFGGCLDIARPNPLPMLIPCSVLALFVMRACDVADWLPALCAAVGIGIALTLVTLAADPSSRRDVWVLAGLTVLYGGYGYGIVVGANTLLDASPLRVVSSDVVGKHHTRSRGGRLCYLELAASPSAVETRRVACSVYDQVSAGERVRVETWRGALGFRWSVVRPPRRAWRTRRERWATRSRPPRFERATAPGRPLHRA